MVVHCYYTGGREYQCAGKTTRVREAELADEESVVVKSHENVGWVMVALMAHEDDMKEERKEGPYMERLSSHPMTLFNP
jgi:hypothetical protein